MSILAGNGAPGASGTGLALGYTLNLFWFNILFMLFSKNNMNTNTYFIFTLSLFYAMKLLVIFEIKIYRKLPKYLTHHDLCSGLEFVGHHWPIAPVAGKGGTRKGRLAQGCSGVRNVLGDYLRRKEDEDLTVKGWRAL